MRVGGSGKDGLLMVFPLTGMVFIVTVWFGGPSEALGTAERMLFDLWSAVLISFRH